MNPEQLNLNRILVFKLNFEQFIAYHFRVTPNNFYEFMEFSTWGLLISISYAHGEGYRNYGGSGNYKSKYH